MIDWTILFSSIGAFIFPGSILLEDAFSVIKAYNKIIKEGTPRKFIILSMSTYSFIIFLGCWLAIYSIWPEYISLLIWYFAFLVFVIVSPFSFFIMSKLLLNMVDLVKSYEGIDITYWKKVENKAGVLWVKSILVFVGEVGLIIYVLVDILK